MGGGMPRFLTPELLRQSAPPTLIEEFREVPDRGFIHARRNPTLVVFAVFQHEDLEIGPRLAKLVPVCREPSADTKWPLKLSTHFREEALVPVTAQRLSGALNGLCPVGLGCVE
jgi:hypothetical protein